MNEESSYMSALQAQTEYCGEFMHRGRKWGMNFFAVDDADAIDKLESMKRSLVVVGRLELTIPCT